MKRISFRLAIALFTFVLGVASAWLAGSYPESTGYLIEPISADNLVEPISDASVRGEKKPRFRFVEQFCESGCEEIYETSDGQQLSLVIACYSISPKYARRDMRSLMADGRVIKREWRRNSSGRRGERTVVLYPKDETGEKPAKIFWYHRGESCFSYIAAGSPQLALEFERSDVVREESSL